MLGRFAIIIAACGMLVASGCVVDVPDIDEVGVFQCTQASDCASGYACGQDGFCFKGNSSSDACASNPCLNDPSGPICQTNPGSVYHCTPSCDQSACPAGFACVHVTASQLECRRNCGVGASEGSSCGVSGNEALCSTVKDKSSAALLVCVSCNPVAQMGGCAAPTTCASKPGPHEYFDALECVGASCSADSTCTTPPLTACLTSRCRNPCDASPYPCADDQACVPSTVSPTRSECVACDPGQNLYCPDGRYCVNDTPANVCIPPCIDATGCVNNPTRSRACVPMNTIGNGTQSVCTYCPEVCTGTLTCAASGATLWSQAASCQGAGGNHAPIALASCNPIDASGCKIQHGTSTPTISGGPTIFQLDGSGSHDQDNDTLTYAWSQLFSAGDLGQCQSGFSAVPQVVSGATFPDGANQKVATIVAPMAVGNMVFALKVTDPGNLTSTSCVLVVSTDNPPADGKVDFSNTPNSVTSGTAQTGFWLTAQYGSDPDTVDQNNLAYVWTADAFGGLTVSLGTSQENGRKQLVTVTGLPPSAVVLTFRVTVTDGLVPSLCTTSPASCADGGCCINITVPYP